ncbi:hypothetical protein H072_244 [Dactylellina haptotyla CBS 200.50]|uniref:Uncharacterized protein n=1 Tax=Dactylellina haptotyla (strain CBS 200.50) TaxID=1284197 RepID=S8CDZ6_DACHA|nr:hypothetical protein H072_244 [Dactylellina haptotyla CBS 200.50]
MWSKPLFSALIIYGLLGLQASATPVAAPAPPAISPKAAGSDLNVPGGSPNVKPEVKALAQKLEPGQWKVPNNHKELSALSEDQMKKFGISSSVGKRDDLARLEPKSELDIWFASTSQQNNKRAADAEGQPNQYLAQMKLNPSAEDSKAHPIIRYEDFKDHLSGRPVIEKYSIKLKFSDRNPNAIKKAQEVWKLDKNDKKDYFYFVIDAPAPEQPDVMRVSLFQVQEATIDGAEAILESYPMAWDVLGEIDTKIYGLKPKAKSLRALEKRFDFNPVIEIPVGTKGNHSFELQVYPISPFKEGDEAGKPAPGRKGIKGAVDKIKGLGIEPKISVGCKECYTEGHLELAAHFKTSWWHVQEASVTLAAKGIKGVLDIQATAEFEKGWDKTAKITKQDWRATLAHAPLTPLTIF